MDKKVLDIYLDYLIAQNQYATATGLSSLIDGEISHDKIIRFLNSKETSSKELWQYVKSEIRRVEENTGGVLILDDTIEEKTYTDESEIICWHHFHAKGRFVKGVNLLSALIRYGDIALPIACEVVHKDLFFCDIATRKEKRRSSITKNEMFRSIIAPAIKNEVKFDYVLSDNWFGAKKNMEFIHYDMKKKKGSVPKSKHTKPQGWREKSSPDQRFTFSCCPNCKDLQKRRQFHGDSIPCHK